MDPIQAPHPHGAPFLRVLALLAFALIIVVLSSLGAYWYVNNQTAQQTQTQQQLNQPVSKVVPSVSNSVVTPAVDETANWKIYTSKQEPTLSFKYPPNWSFKKNVSDDPRVDSITLISPNGTQILWHSNFGSPNSGSGGSCTGFYTVNWIDPIKNAKGLYLIDYTNPSTGLEFMGVGLIDASVTKTNPILDCLYKPDFVSKDNLRVMIFKVSGLLAPKDNPKVNDTVKQVLESLIY